MEQKYLVAKAKTNMIQEHGGNPTIIGSLEVVEYNCTLPYARGVKNRLEKEAGVSSGEKLIIIPYFE
jgi:hypothetical protein